MFDIALLIIVITAILGVTFWLGWSAGVSYGRVLASNVASTDEHDTGNELGTYLFVQFKCASCHKFNRVAKENIGKRPLCGQCKHKLLPTGAVTFLTSTVTNLNSSVFSLDLMAARGNYDKTWTVIAAEFERSQQIRPN